MAAPQHSEPRGGNDADSPRQESGSPHASRFWLLLLGAGLGGGVDVLENVAADQLPTIDEGITPRQNSRGRRPFGGSTACRAENSPARREVDLDDASLYVTGDYSEPSPRLQVSGRKQ